MADRLKAVAYSRVSSKEQEKEGFSISSQVKLCKAYADANCMQLLSEFVDVETAKHTGRRGFTEMISFLKRNSGCRVLLVEKTDRLYRNLKDWVTLDDLDLEIHFIKENVILSRDSRSSEKFMHGIKVLMAKNYIDNLSEESRKGMLEKAEQGIWPSFAPLGYRNVLGSHGKKVIEPDPAIAPLITRLFEWYATGTFSIKEVARKAKGEGFVFRKSQNPVSQATVHKILRNRIYTGSFDWAGKTHLGTHAPLITVDLWERVQGILDHRFSKRNRKAKHDFAFSGLIKCGNCGCSFVGEIKKQRYVYYHCTGYRGKCGEPYTREEVLEERFTHLLRDLTFDDEILGWVKEALLHSHKDEQRYHDEAVTRLQAEHSKLQGRIDAMYVDKLDGLVDQDFFQRKAAEWRDEQDRIQRDIEGHQTANRTYLAEGVQLLDLASRAHSLFQKQEPREKRRLLNFVLSNCTWQDDKLSVEYRKPFDFISEMAVKAKEGELAGVASEANFDNWLPG